MTLNIFYILATILLSIFSTAVLTYISMAVMIGPWIHSTIILILTFIFGFFLKSQNIIDRNKAIATITSGASIGGILATGCGFAFPTLFFLNRELFNNWLSYPVFFISTISLISFLAGALGLLLANIFEKKFLVTDNLPFPISQINYKLITVQESISKSIQLIIGFILTFFYDLISRALKIKNIAVNNSFSFKFFDFPALRFPILEMPMLLAIGFVTGHVIALPLIVGIISKLGIMNPLHKLYFSDLSSMDFSFAFITGLVIYGTALSFFQLPQYLPQFFGWITGKAKNVKNIKIAKPEIDINWPVLISLFITLGIFLYYFKFSLLFQIYLIITTTICTYQILPIGGEYGLAPVGRYATFVMMPAYCLFGYHPVQLTLISTFVEVCGGVAVDILFGRKLAQLTDIDHRTIKIFQWIGLITSSIAVGIFFYILVKKFGLGSPELIAQRGQTRALTLQFSVFDVKATAFGALFGAVLKELKINPIMVLGGLLLPLEWSLILAIGGLISYSLKNREEYYPFWSGIFSASSLLMIFKST